MDENCLIFDPDSQRSKEHEEIFERYKKLIDALLDAFCEDAKITTEQAMEGINRLNKIPDIHDLFYGLFEQVLSATDFNIFYAAMAKRNIMIQEQVLAMILESTGALPSSLTRDDRSKELSVTPNVMKTDDKQEQELLRLVMQKSTNEKATKPKRIEQELCLKTTEISQQEAESLARERKLLEQQMQYLVIESKHDISSSHSTNATSESSTKDKKVPGRVSEDMTSEQAANVWLKSAQSELSAAKSSTHTALAASLSQLSPDEIVRRQEFLRRQRDKLLAMKKEAREKQLEEVERTKGVMRPVSARAARVALHSSPAQQSATSVENEKKMAMRRAIAEKLRQEVISKQ
jgi:hypothetical protein